MVKKKKLVDILADPEQPNVAEGKPLLSVSAGELDLRNHSQDTIEIVHQCDSGFDAFALALELCARISSLDQRFSLRLSKKTNTFVIRTDNDDCIKLAFEAPSYKVSYQIENRIQAFRVVAFLFREIRRIGHVNICISENVWQYFFILEINSFSCIFVHYNARVGEYGDLTILKEELDKVLTGDDPANEQEALALDEGQRIYDACSEIVIPDEFSFLADVDISDIKPIEQIYVTKRDSRPVQQIPPKEPVKSDEKRARKQRLRMISQQKQVEKKSYNSFWDRIEMRGDHDD